MSLTQQLTTSWIIWWHIQRTVVENHGFFQTSPIFHNPVYHDPVRILRWRPVWEK